jgi:hypothetical protein
LLSYSVIRLTKLTGRARHDVMQRLSTVIAGI